MHLYIVSFPDHNLNISITVNHFIKRGLSASSAEYLLQLLYSYYLHVEQIICRAVLSCCKVVCRRYFDCRLDGIITNDWITTKIITTYPGVSDIFRGTVLLI